RGGRGCVLRDLPARRHGPGAQRGLTPGRAALYRPLGVSRSATASPGYSERWGVWGAMSGPPISEAWRSIEERHGFAGVLRALGGLGGHVGAPHFRSLAEYRGAPRLRRGTPSVGGFGGPCRGPPFPKPGGVSRSATASPGCSERWGVWG